jgi:ParB family chromosome partitioning protein
MSSDSVLGRSLQNILTRTARREGAPAGAAPVGMLEVELGLVRPPAANPRQHFDQASLDELAESIKQHGILQPLVVMRLDDGGFEILAGERRWRAARLAGLERVPVVVRDRDDPRHIAELRLIENIQRQDLDPVELANAYRALLDEHGLTHEELAARLGKERSSISNTLRLLQLDPGLQKELVTGALSMGHAKALLSLEDAAAQRELARRVIDDGLSVRETEAAVKLKGRATRGAAKPIPPHIQELEANLHRLFGAPVKVKEQGGKGTLTIAFHSKQSFQRIIEILDKACRQAQQA